MCGVCGSKFDYRSGALVGRVAKEGLSGLFGSLMSKNVGGPISAFEVRQATDGKVYVASANKA